ncbi:MAG: hypothetical protein DRO36_06010 [Candidatus Hecatellales archaeon]|nr:MAG: hypothetical protein DRO36_06010 [Candidatus Hecatellales archaeon]
MPPNKAVVGDSIFSIESGIIASWFERVDELNFILEIFPFTPEFVGHEPPNIVLGKKVVGQYYL